MNWLWKWGDFMGMNATESEDVLLKKKSQTGPVKESNKKQKSAKKSESKEEMTEVKVTSEEEEEDFSEPEHIAEHIEMLQEEIQEKNQQIESIFLYFSVSRQNSKITRKEQKESEKSTLNRQIEI